MKTNVFKTIFFTIVILLTILAIYIIYKDNKNERIPTNSKKTDVKINKEMNLGICNFDTINPLLTQNKDVQYVDKLVFNSLVNVNKNFEIENDLAQEISKINDKTYISDEISNYAFNSRYSCDFSKVNNGTFQLYYDKTESVGFDFGAFFIRLIITLAIEIGIAFIFKFNKKLSLMIFIQKGSFYNWWLIKLFNFTIDINAKAGSNNRYQSTTN